MVGKKGTAEDVADHANARENSAGETSRHGLLQVVVDLVEDAGGREPPLAGADEQGEVLVMKPASTVSTQTYSRVAANRGEIVVALELVAVGRWIRLPDTRDGF